MLTLNLNLRTSTKKLKSINLIVRYNGIAFSYSTGYKIESCKWNVKSQQAVNGYDDSLNTILSTFILKTKAVYRDFKADNNLTEPSKDVTQQDFQTSPYR